MSGSDVANLAALVRDVGLPIAILLLFLAGFRFEWWVPGTHYRWVRDLCNQLVETQKKRAEADEARVNALLDDARRERR